jgi:hypothetical protein
MRADLDFFEKCGVVGGVRLGVGWIVEQFGIFLKLTMELFHIFVKIIVTVNDFLISFCMNVF